MKNTPAESTTWAKRFVSASRFKLTWWLSLPPRARGSCQQRFNNVTNHHKETNQTKENNGGQVPEGHGTFTPLIYTVKPPTVADVEVEGYLPSVLVDGSAVGWVDAVAVPVDPLHQSVVARPSHWVQPRWEAALRRRQQMSVKMTGRGFGCRWTQRRAPVVFSHLSSEDFH